MEQVLKQLNEIESASNQILAQAEAKKDHLNAEMKEKTEAFDTALKADTEKRIQELHEKLTLGIDDSLDLQKKNVTDTLNRIQEMYDAKHEELAQSILERMVKE